jgi:S-formylglutathione hydrolase FrmB
VIPPRRLAVLVTFIALALLPAGAEEQAANPIRFRVRLAEDASPQGAAGRLLIFMTNDPKPVKSIGTGFIPGSTYVAAMEIQHLVAGGTVEVNPDLLAFPKAFSEAPPGNYQVMALLDQNQDYNYSGEGEGDLRSEIGTLESLDPAKRGAVDLLLSTAIPARVQPADSDSVKLVEFQSPALTEFWGRPVMMRAALALPPVSETGSAAAVPTIYSIKGFGASAIRVRGEAVRAAKQMADGKIPAVVHVFLDPSAPGGHHVFADSVNNGPWGRALTTEFIPYLEQKFHLVGVPHARFLTGHSSGGWSTLWLQITYPEFFGGTWSTAPDPVDLRNYTGINATPGSKDNAYREVDGSPRQLVRMEGKWVASFEDFARQERVIGEHGGQFASFEWVWSPRGRDGRPMKLFNRETGALNPGVLDAWQRYDIRRNLAERWDSLAPKLEGKLNLFCGANDTFRLNESFELLRAFLKEKNSTAVCELIEDRHHGDLYKPHPTYPQGLFARIYSEAMAKFEAGQRAGIATAP